MIYFDKRTLSVLRYIQRRGERGVKFEKLRNKFGYDSNSFLLQNFIIEFYVIAQDSQGNWINKDECPPIIESDFRFYSTSKANELIETRIFNFWKWVIPTLISIVALVVSIITFIVQ